MKYESGILLIVLVSLLTGCATLDSTGIVSADDLKFLNKDPKIGIARVGNYYNDGKLRVFEDKSDVYIYVYENDIKSGFLYGLKGNTEIRFSGDKRQAKKLADKKIQQLGLKLMADDPDIQPGSNVYYEVSLMSGMEVLIRPYETRYHYRSYRIEIIDYSNELKKFKAALINNNFKKLGNYNYYDLQAFLKKEIGKYLSKKNHVEDLEPFLTVLNRMAPAKFTRNMVPLTTRNSCLVQKRKAEIELLTKASNINSVSEVMNWTNKRKKAVDRCFKITRKKLVANRTPKRGDLRDKWEWTYERNDYIQGYVGANWVKISKREYYWKPESIVDGYISKRDVVAITPIISKQQIAKVARRHKNILVRLADEKDKKDFLVASNKSSISSYKKYLAEHPKGKFKLKADKGLLIAYRNLNTFNGFMQAYQLSNAQIDIQHAYQNANTNQEFKKVEIKLLDSFGANNFIKINVLSSSESKLEKASTSSLLYSIKGMVRDYKRKINISLDQNAGLPFKHASYEVQLEIKLDLNYSISINGKGKDYFTEIVKVNLTPENNYSKDINVSFNGVLVHGEMHMLAGTMISALGNLFGLNTKSSDMDIATKLNSTSLTYEIISVSGE